MKNKITLSFVSILLLLFVFLINVSATTIITPDTGGNIYFDYDSDDTTSYYQSLNGLNGEEFKTELHEIISSGNIAKYSYNDVKTLLMQLDEDPNNENNILCLLTGKSMPKSSFGGTGREAWNREHIWPKSHGFNNESLSPYTDLNHLRAAEAYTNSTYHNDYDYGELLEGYTEDKYGNKYVSNLGDGQGVYEPRDAIKGDIARMIMYMDVRYEGDQLSSDIQLEISNDHTAPSSMTGQIGMLDTLIKWHQQDPVDDLERQRNDLVYTLQGNRNPFIDHPEYANYIYECDYLGKNEDEYRVLYYVENGTFDYVDYTHYKSGDKLIEPSTEPISSRLGYEFGGWSTEDGTIWDFSLDVIATDDLKLYASWDYIGLSLQQSIEESKTYSSLRLTYKMNEVDNATALTQTTSVTVATEGIVKSVPTNQVLTYDEYLTYNKNDIQIYVETNSKANVYVSAGVIRLYPGKGNGTGLRFAVKEGSNAVIDDVTITIKEGNLDTFISDGKLKKEVAEDGSYVLFQNIINANTSNQINITAITITYHTEVLDFEPEFIGNVKLNFTGVLPKELYNELNSKYENVKYGIIVNGNSYNLDPIVVDDEIHLKYIIDDSNYNKVYTAKIFITFDNTTYYMKEASYSVKTLAIEYINNHITEETVSENSKVLKYLINQ